MAEVGFTRAQQSPSRYRNHIGFGRTHGKPLPHISERFVGRIPSRQVPHVIVEVVDDLLSGSLQHLHGLEIFSRDLTLNYDYFSVFQLLQMQTIWPEHKDGIGYMKMWDELSIQRASI